MSTVSAAQIGAAWEVPAPSSDCWPKTIRTPVDGSATAATSGASRSSLDPRSTDSLSCHAGRSNSADPPPLVPWDSGESPHAYSASHRPCASVDSVVPPTEVIDGSDEMASRPMSLGPGGEDQSSPPLHSRPP